MASPNPKAKVGRGAARGPGLFSSTPIPVSILRPNYCGSPRCLDRHMSPGFGSWGYRPEQRNCLGPFESTLWTPKVWSAHPTETCPWAELCSFAFEQHLGCPAANAEGPPLTAHPLSKLCVSSPFKKLKIHNTCESSSFPGRTEGGTPDCGCHLEEGKGEVSGREKGKERHQPVPMSRRCKGGSRAWRSHCWVSLDVREQGQAATCTQSPSGPEPPPPLRHRGQMTASGAGPGLEFPWGCSQSPKHFQGPKERQVEAGDPPATP